MAGNWRIRRLSGLFSAALLLPAMRALILACAFVWAITSVVVAEEDPVAIPVPFQGLVSHQRSMLSSRWLTLATPWFVLEDKTLPKGEREERIKDLGRTIDQLISALTCDQLTIAENMGMMQVYLILTRFIKKFPSKENEFVHVADTDLVMPFWQEIFDKMKADEQATQPPKSLRSRRHTASIAVDGNFGHD